MKTPTDQLLPTLSTWDLRDLRDLQSALTGLIEALESPPEKGLTLDGAGPEEPEKGLPAKPPQKTARGHIEAKYIPRGSKIHGPYLYLRYWQGGKLRSKYLGKPR